MKKFTKKLLAASICSLLASAQAEELSTLVVEDSLPINPNSSEPEAYNRTKAVVSDGADFLSQINGISASRFGGRGLEPIIRGQSQTRINVLLDGAYVHGGCPNRMDPPTSWAALETYEEVTVLKGVQSVIYGGGGSGGTVLFERDTRSLAEEKGVHGRVSGMASSNGIDYDFLGDVTASGEQGYIRGFAEIKDADNYEDGNGDEVRSSYKHKQGGIVLGWTPTEDRLLEFTYERNDFSDALYPGGGMDSPEEEGDFYRLKYADKFQDSWLDGIKIETYLSDVDHVMDNYSLRTPPKYPASHMKAGMDMKRRTPTNSKTTGGRIILESSFNQTNITYGADLQRNERDGVLLNEDGANPIDLSYMWPDARIEQYGVFAEATTPVSQAGTIKYGLRIDRVEAEARDADDKPSMASPNMAYMTYYGTKADTENETNVGGLLRYTHKLTNDLSLFSGISRSVRTADATERYINKWHMMGSMRWVGNPELDPEKHHQIDLGITQSTDKYEASAVVFYDHVDDYILRDTARSQDGILLSDNADIYRNVDAKLIGAEIDGWYKLNDNFEISASLAYVRATNTTDSNRPIAQTPPLNGKVQLDYNRNNWGVGSRFRFADKQDRIDDLSKQEVGETAGWGVLDLYANYQFKDNLNLRAGIDNVFDKNYAEHTSRSNLLDPVAIKVNEPGRVVWLKLVADF